MNLKKILIYIFTGFCMGGMMMAVLEKIGLRTSSYGGEVLFIPCVVLCVWLGWILKTETMEFIRREKNVNSRRK